MTTVVTDTGVGPLLRGWREQRRLSQLELALRADSSARHISFVETGRSRPSEEMVLKLAEHLEVPVRERNALLLAAGYAPRYAESPLDAPRLETLRWGIQQLLDGYEPYPALVVDGTYTVVAANRGIELLLGGVPEHLLTPPMNAMRLPLCTRRAWRPGSGTCGSGGATSWPRWSVRSRWPVRSRCGSCRGRRGGVRCRSGSTRRTGRTRSRIRTSRCRCGSNTTAGCCRSCRRSRRSTRRWT
ncbi:hypothetical protein STANM309S_04230 [Streptomyces tanashiensis]